jgi:site-specific recombinase XerD
MKKNENVFTSPALIKLQKIGDDSRGRNLCANTARAYSSAWRHYINWCESQSLAPYPLDVRTIVLYLTACAALKETSFGLGLSLSAIKQRLAALAHYYRLQGSTLPRKHPELQRVITQIMAEDALASRKTTPLLAPDIIKICSTLPRRDVRSVRDRALLLLAFAGGLRRSEVVGLDRWCDDTVDGLGWVEFKKTYIVVHLKSGDGWRKVPIGPGSTKDTCPVEALRNWLDMGEIMKGPIFRPIAKGGRRISPNRLDGSYLRTLVGKLSNPERWSGSHRRYSAHSLRAGFVSSAKADEQIVQKQLGYKSSAMIKKYSTPKA